MTRALATPALLVRRRLALAAGLTLAATGGGGSTASAEDPAAAPLWSAASDPMRDAEETWSRGLAFFASECRGSVQEPFEAIDGGVRSYLLRDRHSRAEWSCAIHGDPAFVSLDQALLSGEPMRQLHALVVLVRSRTSADVESQWRVLESLRRSPPGGTRSARLLDQIADEFAEVRVLRTLEDAAGGGPGVANDGLLWAMRAAGIGGSPRAVALLSSLAREGDGDVEMTAILALRRARTDLAYQALWDIVRTGRRPFALRAAVVLGSDAPEVIRSGLRVAGLPRDTRDRGLIGLASAGDRTALAEIVPTLPDMQAPERSASLDVLAENGGPEIVPLLRAVLPRLTGDTARRARDVLSTFD